MATAAEDLDGQGLADALVANHAVLVDAECRELVLAAQWADLHPAESLEPRPVLAGVERSRRFGGFGTPEAGEFCAAELAVLTGRSVGAAATLIADALDLRRRQSGGAGAFGDVAGLPGTDRAGPEGRPQQREPVPQVEGIGDQRRGRTDRAAGQDGQLGGAELTRFRLSLIHI